MWKDKILMCSPTYYGIDYEINPWMHIENKVDLDLAKEQWIRLHHLILRCGGYVEYISQKPCQPDMVFTANAGIVKDEKFFVSTFKNKERSNEEQFFTEWFLDKGFEVSKLSSKSKMKFEGAGDCLEWGDLLVAGYGHRSTLNASLSVGKRLGYEEDKIKEVELVDPRFYHLDTCFCPLNNCLALVYMGAFNQFLKLENSKFGKDVVKNIIEVDEKDAVKFACNCVVIGDHVIMPSGCENTANKIAEKGFKVHLTDMSEFIKSGGACKCLTLKISSF